MGLHDQLVLDHRDKAEMFGMGLLVDLGDHDGDRQPGRVDVGDDQLAGLEAVEAAILLGDEVQAVDLVLIRGRACRDLAGAGDGLFIRRPVGAHLPLGVHQAVHRQACALGDLVVVEVMGAGDLHGTAPEGGIGVFVRDDRDQAVAQRQVDHLADDGSVTLVRGMDRHRAVAQHGLGASGRDRDVIPGLAEGHRALGVLLDVFIGLTARQTVFEVPHMALHLDVLDL